VSRRACGAPITGKQDGEDILLKMADAIHHLFGDDTRLSKMVVFGRKLAAPCLQLIQKIRL
jgi:hypothetical protein